MTESTRIADDASENARLARSGYEAFGRGDFAGSTANFDPGVTWHAQRLGQLGGDHVGVAAVIGFFGRSMELTRGTFRMEVLDALGSDQHAAVLVRSTAQREGRNLDSRQVHLFRVQGGRVLEIWQYVDDAEAVSAFWA